MVKSHCITYYCKIIAWHDLVINVLPQWSFTGKLGRNMKHCVHKFWPSLNKDQKIVHLTQSYIKIKSLLLFIQVSHKELPVTFERFFVQFLEDISPFCGATGTLGLDFGDISRGFQSNGGSLTCMLCCLCTLDSSD